MASFDKRHARSGGGGWGEWRISRTCRDQQREGKCLGAGVQGGLQRRAAMPQLTWRQLHQPKHRLSDLAALQGTFAPAVLAARLTWHLGPTPGPSEPTQASLLGIKADASCRQEVPPISPPFPSIIMDQPYGPRGNYALLSAPTQRV